MAGWIQAVKIALNNGSDNIIELQRKKREAKIVL
jgi:hypothetical protein